MRLKNEDVHEIVTGPREEVRTRLRELFLEGKTSFEIAEAMNGTLLTRNDVGVEVKASVIRAALLSLTTRDERKAMNSKKHSKRQRSNHASQDRGRNRWMREQGMHVWTPAQQAFFEELIKDPAMRRSETRLNHEKIARALRRRFKKRFTKEMSASHYEYMRVSAAKKSAEARVSELSADVRGQLDEAVGVAPLVVVPAEGFDEAALPGGLHFGELGVDDATVAVADDVLGDDRAALDA